MTGLPGFGERRADENGIQCHVCGQWFKHLVTHVTKTHGFASADAYRQEFGLSRRGLVAESTREKYRRNAEANRLAELGIPTRVTEARENPAISPEGRAVGDHNLYRGYNRRERRAIRGRQ